MSAPLSNSSIVVGVDGSPASRCAVDWAARDAAMRNVPLTIVHAIGRITLPQAQIPAHLPRWQEEQAQQLISDAVDLARHTTVDGAPAQVATEVLSSAVVPALVDLSRQATMVVVGSRGRGAMARTVLGSVSSSLIRHAHCPVAVIHDEDPLMPHPAEAPVLVGIDGSPASELATAVAFDEASRRGVELIALHAWSDIEALHFI
ncbi:MAG TPA: universal stress protein, partial [Mycobacterium sp.]|nr:universal stress protein [Mycobacterium sp.]